ncbi:PEP-CTERM sorting domain-containing protein [Polaromonas sp. UC242_47]|uniref:PEP-CTERM sorting domain-containing protein n=1 Tax=Polaromonas sp. UC242_47 TaxID=3374626 RepID=UPI0037A90550
MKTKRVILAALAALSFAVTAPQAIAAPITFEFWTPTGLLGSSESYTVGTTTITAYSGSYSGTTVTRGLQLNGVNGGTNNQGLGICNAAGSCSTGNGDPSVNLDGAPPELIQLDLSDLYADGYSLIKINSDRATNIELLRIYASSTITGLGTLLASINDASGDFAISTGGLRYLNFIAFPLGDPSTAQVLLHSLTADVAAVPEPATLTLLGVGLAGLALSRRRTLKVTAAA